MPDLAQLEAELSQPLERLLAEARGEVYRPVLRVCRNGHEITNPWMDDKKQGCLLCCRIYANRRLRQQARTQAGDKPS